LFGREDSLIKKTKKRGGPLGSKAPNPKGGGRPEGGGGSERWGYLSENREQPMENRAWKEGRSKNLGRSFWRKPTERKKIIFNRGPEAARSRGVSPEKVTETGKEESLFPKQERPAGEMGGTEEGKANNISRNSRVN